MFNRLKLALGGLSSTAPTPHQRRLQAMLDSLDDEPEQTFLDSADADHRVDIHAFGRNFVEACDSESEDDLGYVLVTNGMSDRLMPAPHGDAALQEDGDSRAVELVWYVRDLNPELISNLRWLAKLPAFDNFFLASGHRVPMPEAPLSFCAFKTFFFLTPVYGPDARLLDDVTVGDNQNIATLTVNLISDAEYALAKSDAGLDVLLDLFDENSYPDVFDPQRISYA